MKLAVKSIGTARWTLPKCSRTSPANVRSRTDQAITPGGQSPVLCDLIVGSVAMESNRTVPKSPVRNREREPGSAFRAAQLATLVGMVDEEARPHVKYRAVSWSTSVAVTTAKYAHQDLKVGASRTVAANPLGWAQAYENRTSGSARRNVMSLLREREIKKASLVCGTYGKRLWLLRSRPDQVGRATMRRGPPLRILSAKRRWRTGVSQNFSRPRRWQCLNAELIPNFVDACFHLLSHCNSRTPLTRALARPFVGCIDTHFAAKTANR